MTSRNDITQLLDGMFCGEQATPQEVAVVATALGSDADAREYYDRIARVDAELGGDFEARFGEAWFLDGLDAMLAEEAAVPAPVPLETAANTNRPVGMWLSVAALVLFSLAGLFAVPAPVSEFQARSAVSTADRAPYGTPELGVFCVNRDGNDVRFLSAQDFEFGTVRCAVDAEIKLAARSADRRLGWGAFLGIAADGTMYWYGPSPANPAAVPVEHADSLRPLGETIRLNVNHDVGTVRVVGIFSEEPLEWPAVERIVRSNATRLRDGSVVIDGAMIVRQTFEVTE